MAVKWAVANGNWNAGATWNDGVVPTIGDSVYLNGYYVLFTSTIYADEISNLADPNHGIAAGGYLACSGSVIINSNIYGGTTTPIQMSFTGSNQKLLINGNISCYGCASCLLVNITSRSNCTIQINGNVTTDHYIIDSTVQQLATIVINGNVNSSESIYIYYNSTVYTLTNVILNGEFRNITPANNIITNLTVSGNLIRIADVQRCINFTINGRIEYVSTTNTIGISYVNCNILNPDTFTWKDVTEPRSNPFIIVTNADMNNRQQYPPEDEVKQGTEYAWGEKAGTYTPDYPPESVVLQDYEYGDSDDRKTGTMTQEVNVEVGCVTPEDVRKDVPLVGMGVVGSLVVPSIDDVREGVIFDNGSVGTLIVQGGGDRLRIADFSYYTNAQSDTYIVDLTEQDKPKFAVAEERVLIEMFPDLDLDNIPEKYFDDLFVKYLKYRLIVEYYRTAGINSTFTPSEPTTEIVNYQNVRNEVWLNSANIYLKAWGEKYPNSIKKQRIIL